jgi:hypothetical protein
MLISLLIFLYSSVYVEVVDMISVCPELGVENSLVTHACGWIAKDKKFLQTGLYEIFYYPLIKMMCPLSMFFLHVRSTSY